MRCRSAIAALALLAALLGEGEASAYCRSSVCKDDSGNMHGQVCTPPAAGDCGTVLQWRQPCVHFSLQKNGSKHVQFDVVEEQAKKAFASWMQIDCGGGAHPSIEIDDFGAVSCAKVEYNQHEGNANIIMFRDDVWPHPTMDEGATDTIALTTVTYDVTKGDIFDADMEINGVQNNFTTSDTKVDVDLLSVLTHEAGHFLGLAHSSVEAATMYPSYVNGSIALRAPKDDDAQAICSAYPPDRDAKGTCDGLPRHGFSPECLGAQNEGTCALAITSGDQDLPLAAFTPALALLGLARRRHPRNRRRVRA